MHGIQCTEYNTMNVVVDRAPSRSLTPEGKLRQERTEEKKHARIDHETQQRTTVSIVLPTGEEPLGLVLISRKPRSATMKRMVAGGLSGCGTMVAKIEKNSFFNGLNKRKCIRKGMRLGMVGGINVDTHTVVEVQRMIVAGRKQGSVTCTFHIPPSRSLTPEGRIKKKTNDKVLAERLDLKKNLTSTVIFSEGSLGLELVARKPRPETIEQRVARRNKEQADEKVQERNVLEKDIRKYARQATMLEFFEGLDTHNQGYISKTALWSTCALHGHGT
jgi:hypothetical protein